jgi:hypothetical protein
MKKIISLMAASVLLAGVSLAQHEHDMSQGHGTSHDKEKSEQSSSVTVTGQIVDPVCLLTHNDSGPEHRNCAQACAKMGIGLVFHNDTDHQLYNIMPTGHADPNAKVVEFAEKRVQIIGVLHKKAGYQAIEIQEIKELGEGQKLSLGD